ncbi:MAG: N-acetylglucosamine-6-phosphate deacetylase, partial [Pseudomonadota bacterium]
DRVLERATAEFRDGVLTSVGPARAKTPGAVHIDLGGDILAPGYVDLQVNGGGGKLLNDDPSVETIQTIAKAHAQFGTTAMLPTLISDDLEKVRAAISAVDSAIEQGIPGIVGIHLEGPFLSTDRKGVHDESKFRDFGTEHVELMSSLNRGQTLVTLSPERASPDVIRALREQGVVVSAGHTDASYQEMRAAMEAGVTGFTHLFNAMSPLTSREPGVVGAALEDPNSWCGIIVDGHHVSPATLRLALRCKPLEKFMLVTDAMPSVGMEDGSFQLQGRRIHVEDGICMAEDGTLAGSDLDMARAVRNTIATLDVRLEDACAMASAHPAQFIGLSQDIGSICVGARADFALVDSNLHVISSWIGGKKVHG